VKGVQQQLYIENSPTSSSCVTQSGFTLRMEVNQGQPMQRAY